MLVVAQAAQAVQAAAVVVQTQVHQLVAQARLIKGTQAVAKQLTKNPQQAVVVLVLLERMVQIMLAQAVQVSLFQLLVHLLHTQAAAVVVHILEEQREVQLAAVAQAVLTLQMALRVL
jgi:hypothetical protein